jgi:hypothetical protein
MPQRQPVFGRVGVTRQEVVAIAQSVVVSSGGGGGGGGTGDVVGPAGAADNRIPFFNGATGKLLKDSTLTLADVQASTVALAAAAILPIDLAADVTGDLPLANLAQAAAASRLLGRGSSGGAGDWEALTVGAGVGIVGTALRGTAGTATSTATGTLDDFDFSGASVLRMDNATAATIRGFLAGVDGQLLTVVSIGAGTVYFAHQNAGSAAANRLINYVTAAATPITAGGSATFCYDATTARWRMVSHSQGAYVNIAHAAGNFNASVGAWGVDLADQVTYAYVLNGRIMTVIFQIERTDVSLACTTLELTIPDSHVSVKDVRNVMQMANVGVFDFGLARTTVAGTRILFYPGAGAVAPWGATAADDTWVIGQISFEVQ